MREACAAREAAGCRRPGWGASPDEAAPLGMAEAQQRGSEGRAGEWPSRGAGPGPLSALRPANLSTRLPVSDTVRCPGAALQASTGPRQGPGEHPQGRWAPVTRLGDHLPLPPTHGKFRKPQETCRFAKTD